MEHVNDAEKSSSKSYRCYLASWNENFSQLKNYLMEENSD